MTKLRHDLFEGDYEARFHAGYDCGKSGDPTLMRAAFDFIDRAGRETYTARFIDGGSATIDALIEHVFATPSSQSGGTRAATDFFDRATVSLIPGGDVFS